jgi:hypothetical protein
MECTFKQRTALSNRANYSTSGELTNRKLHEQQWNSADKQGNEIWQQKNALKKRKRKTITIYLNQKLVGQGNVLLVNWSII